jgi:hypothetical protein
VAVGSLFVDPFSIDDFGTYLKARLDEAHSARLSLMTAPAAALPPLGGFDDAHVTAARLDTLRREYVARLDRLISALTAAQVATRTIAHQYRTVDELAAADPAMIGESVEPVTRALGPEAVPNA